MKPPPYDPIPDFDCHEPPRVPPPRTPLWITVCGFLVWFSAFIIFILFIMGRVS
jgi:hypothetical protein